jgi:hypothetical protein
MTLEDRIGDAPREVSVSVFRIGGADGLSENAPFHDALAEAASSSSDPA